MQEARRGEAEGREAGEVRSGGIGGGGLVFSFPFVAAWPRCFGSTARSLVGWLVGSWVLGCFHSTSTPCSFSVLVNVRYSE